MSKNKDKQYKKNSLHPLSFSAAFIMAAFSALSKNQKASNAFKALTALCFVFGVYNLYNEKRIMKTFRPITNRLSYLWTKTPDPSLGQLKTQVRGGVNINDLIAPEYRVPAKGQETASDVKGPKP